MIFENTNPPTSPEYGAPKPVAEARLITVLFCRGLEKNLPGLNLPSVVRWLSQHNERVESRLVEDLCSEPSAVRKGLRGRAAQGLVLGLCGQDYFEIEAQVHARRMGFDPLGIQVVNLANTYSEDSSNGMVNSRAKLVLAAAVARAQAFPGSQPENMKSVLPSSEKPISRRALLTLPPVTYVSAPTINGKRCTSIDGCDLCVAGCSYRSMEKNGESIIVNRTRCQSCGVCVAVCPQRAVDFPGWSAGELEAQVSNLLNAESDLETRQVVFVCSKATVPAGPDWLTVPVPCISMITVGVLLQTLANGAGATAILPCDDGCPTSLTQTFRERVDYCRQLLDLLGGPSEAGRVRSLGNEEASLISEIPKQIPPSADTSNKPISLFGTGVAAEAVRTLFQRYGTDDLTLEHPQSPFGLVKIDKEACTGCKSCAAACPTGALSADRQKSQITLNFDHSCCVACDLCETMCPERSAGAIEVQRVTDSYQLSRGAQVVFQGDESLCERCGSPVATQRMVERIAVLLGDDFNMRQMGRLCPDCRAI
jgi:MinD superfamily P-loop ATPase